MHHYKRVHLSARPSIRQSSVCPCVTCFIYMPKMKDFLHQITNDDSILGLLGLVSDEFKTATGRKVGLGLPISASMFFFNYASLKTCN